ncbi:hypothetical protein ACQUY5_26860 [Bacillus cereus]|uniref:hypothetical protein n=1 Tax=Bacillus cereus TaxID=1396 RepID=UPI003D174977
MAKIIELNGETNFVSDIHEFIELLPYDSQKPVYELIDEETGGEDLKQEFKAYEGQVEDQRGALNEILRSVEKMKEHIEGKRLNRKELNEHLDSIHKLINNTI